jgi:uncharacterized protein YjaG (DUF416 family)
MIDNSQFLLADSDACRTLHIENAVADERDRQQRIYDHAAACRHRGIASLLAFETSLTAEQVRAIFDQLK